MECPRCAGLTVPVALIDWEGTYIHCPAEKCLSYGSSLTRLSRNIDS